MRKSHVVFLINLLQDVNIVRPLVLLAAQNLHVSILIMVTYKFLQRDKGRVWQQELAKLCAETNTSVQIYSNESEALACLHGKYGVLIAASESNLSAHRETHNVFRIAPPGFLRITCAAGFPQTEWLPWSPHSGLNFMSAAPPPSYKSQSGSGVQKKEDWSVKTYIPCASALVETLRLHFSIYLMHSVKKRI
jgi:hypothetical protein